MNAIDVSVVIPCFNASPWLATAIDSALAQEEVAVEIIVVDDGSTDDSLRLVEHYADRRVRLLRQSHRGAAAARNAGCQAARGDHFQFLDADDWLAPQKLAIQLGALRRHPPGRLAIGSLAFFPDGDHPRSAQPYRGWPAATTDDPAGWLLDVYGLHGHGGMVQPGQWLVPRAVAERAGPWDESLTLDDDGEYFCRVVLHSTGLVKTSDAVAGYRQYRGPRRNLSAQRTRAALDSEWRALQAKARHLATRGETPAFRRAFAWSFFQFGVKAYPDAVDLSRAALGRSRSLGGCDDDPVVGGRTLQAVSHLLGWKAAKRLSALAARARRLRA